LDRAKRSFSARRAIGSLVGAALLLAFIACDSRESATPSITAQGFDLGETRESEIGEPVSLRLRVEAPAGIESFRVRERSYEVDLGRSPEPSHFSLFGLKRRVWSKTDVTLDFGPYVGQKMSAAGEYAFKLEVTDRKEQTTAATLRVRLIEPEAEEATDDAAAPPEAPGDAGRDSPSASVDPLRSGNFRLERVGPGPVASDDGFGVTWKTIESNRVVIRMVGTDESVSHFARLEPGAFAQIETRRQLARALDGVGLQPSMELAMANDAASGAEIAIVRAKDRYLLRADRSETSLSELGTTVTLTGRYKR
jgi:hypothetical protein